MKDGTEGYIKGALNAPPGIVVGSAIPLKECNIKVGSGSLIPTGIQGGIARATLTSADRADSSRVRPISVPRVPSSRLSAMRATVLGLNPKQARR